ncbi:hypothetical protein H2199_006534 [Coniosporium tulheliwenetii]|uniref:Uncharacterized protein n=1 Tax=Coniosporium tulheliwenetii TaxID=3383036 RepID=A0ACC2YWA0_9PEZI|nr:hypothetical protein H2199_006534 [Cladosporium sp. JES 115]
MGSTAHGSSAGGTGETQDATATTDDKPGKEMISGGQTLFMIARMEKSIGWCMREQTRSTPLRSNSRPECTQLGGTADLSRVSSAEATGEVTFTTCHTAVLAAASPISAATTTNTQRSDQLDLRLLGSQTSPFESDITAATSPTVLLHYALPPPPTTTAQSLQLHLDSLVAELDQRDNLQHLIQTHLQDEDLLDRVNADLDTRMSLAGFTPAQILSSGHEAVQKVRHLRNHASLQHARQLVTDSDTPGSRDLDFSVVDTLQRNGAMLSSDLVFCCVSSSITWPEFQRYLTAASVLWQAELNGCPAGYGSEDGDWKYLVQPPPDPMMLQQFQSLGSEADFMVLKRIVAAGGGVQVWHSGMLKAEWEFLLHRVIEPQSEPVDEDGEAWFWPWFDVGDVLRVPDEVFNAQCLRGWC